MRRETREGARRRSREPSAGPGRAEAGGRLRGLVVRFLVLVGALGAGAWGLVALHRSTREALREDERYLVPVAEIDCPAPPGEDRAQFLSEVRYLADLPARLSVLEEDLPARLAAAFGRHPWVERVDRVAVEPDRQVRVEPVYRQPVLVVAGEGREGLAGRGTVVDGVGVRLPSSAPREGLAVYTGRASPPGPAGTVWADAQVQGAARTADFLRPSREKLGLRELRFERGSFVLKTADGVTVIWGRAPGAERDGELSAGDKLQVLLRHVGKGARLAAAPDGGPWDVRRAENTRP